MSASVSVFNSYVRFGVGTTEVCSAIGAKVHAPTMARLNNQSETDEVVNQLKARPTLPSMSHRFPTRYS